MSDKHSLLAAKRDLAILVDAGRTIWAWTATNAELQKQQRSNKLASLVHTVRKGDMLMPQLMSEVAEMMP